jgi:hypothetical protein
LLHPREGVEDYGLYVSLGREYLTSLEEMKPTCDCRDAHWLGTLMELD